MSNALGRQIIVENVAGAGGVIGSNRVARIAPDGYTLIVSGSGTHAAGECLRKNLPYRSTDFEQIGLINTSAAAPLMETVPQLRKPAILQPALEQPRPRLCPSRPLWRPLMIGSLWPYRPPEKLSVEIMMIIDVPDFGAITALHGKRERIRIKDGARVFTREERLCP